MANQGMDKLVKVMVKKYTFQSFHSNHFSCSIQIPL